MTINDTRQHIENDKTRALRQAANRIFCAARAIAREEAQA